MDNLIFTIIAAIIIMGFVVLAMAIGWLITGKSKLKKRCGFTPEKKKDEEPSCPICGSGEACEKEEEKKK